MSSILSRIATTAAVAAVIFGFGIGAAQAAPMELSEQSQVGPKPDVSDDFDAGEPDNEPEDQPVDPPADEPADEPVDEPAEDDGEDADEESDEDSDEESDDSAEGEDTNASIKPVPAFDAVRTSNRSNGDKDASEDDAVEAFQPTATELTPPSQGTTGVYVPVLGLVAGGAMVVGVTAWAGYRRHRLFTS